MDPQLMGGTGRLILDMDIRGIHNNSLEVIHHMELRRQAFHLLQLPFLLLQDLHHLDQLWGHLLQLLLLHLQLLLLLLCLLQEVHHLLLHMWPLQDRHQRSLNSHLL